MILAVAILLLAAGCLARVAAAGAHGLADPLLWLAVLATLGLAWRLLDRLSALRGRARLLAPVLFGLLVLFLWQVAVVGFDIPAILLPAPSRIALTLAARFDVLWADFEQTVFKSVLAGYTLGCGLGFLAALAADRVPFLARGILPLSGLVSAVPVVGIAPIMVMWFGFGWESKAAVIVVMTVFPMMVNALAGLQASDAMARDLMRSYAAGWGQTLLKLRLPAALPFIFNALKINSTLAMIGAIVAEFFGSPILGLGFRISAEIARMNVDVVWAAITLAAVAGSLFYALIAALERAVTFWHPSYRSQRG